MRDYSLPIEFHDLATKIQYIQKKSHNEYSSSCPECGGSQHPDGSWPDRFILLSRSTATGAAFGFCRKCGYKWWLGKDKGTELTPEEKKAWIAEQEQRVQAEQLAAENKYRHALDMLRQERHWLTYHANLDSEARKMWRYRGIPDEYQDHWCLGYCQNFSTWTRNGEEWHTPTLTIPIRYREDILNIRHRLLKPSVPDDKYRPERAGLGAPPFFAQPDVAYDTEQILVVEGEIKAAVTHLTLADNSFQVIGVPGIRSTEQMVDKLTGKRIWINFDPGAEKPASDFATKVKGRVFCLPTKIDDAINDGLLDKKTLLAYMRTARTYG